MQRERNRIHFTFEIKAELDNFPAFIDFIDSSLAKTGIELKEKIDVITACEELIVNVINYAYSGEKGNLKIDFEADESNIGITFTDSGKEFNPLAGTGPDINLPIEEREAGGLGILMVKNLMDDVKYEFKGGKNCLSVSKKIFHE